MDLNVEKEDRPSVRGRRAGSGHFEHAGPIREMGQIKRLLELSGRAREILRKPGHIGPGQAEFLHGAGERSRKSGPPLHAGERAQRPAAPEILNHASPDRLDAQCRCRCELQLREPIFREPHGEAGERQPAPPEGSAGRDGAARQLARRLRRLAYDEDSLRPRPRREPCPRRFDAGRRCGRGDEGPGQAGQTGSLRGATHKRAFLLA